MKSLVGLIAVSHKAGIRATLHPHWACFDWWVRLCCCCSWGLDSEQIKQRIQSVTVLHHLCPQLREMLLPVSQVMEPLVIQARRESAAEHWRPLSPVPTPGAPFSAWSPAAAVSPVAAAALELQLPDRPSAGSALSPEPPSLRSCVEGPGWP